MTELFEHNGRIVSAQFSPDGKRIVTASGDGTARVWDAQSGQPLTGPLKHNGWVYSAQFSPDGKRIVTTSGGAARVWDVGPCSAGLPDWLLQLAEATSGQALNKQGVLEETRLRRPETIEQIREKLSHESGDDDWLVLGRWLLADPFTRTISPFSKVTVQQYVENRIKEPTVVALDEAETLAAGDPNLLFRISQVRAAFEETNRPVLLLSQAAELVGQAKLAEAEPKLRQAFELNRTLWANDPVKWEPSLSLWVDVLRREGKYEQAEEMLNGILTPPFSAQPQSAGLFRLRADFFARRGQWKQAAADLAKVIEFEPNDHHNYAGLAPLLVASDNLEGYRQLCQRILARFGGTNIPAGPERAGHPEIYERMAKACLILPSAGVDLESVAQLAETAVEAGKNHGFLPYFQFCKGLAEYRRARIAAAVDWTQRALLTGGDSWSTFAQVQAYMVMAMAHRQLGHTNEARTAFGQGIEIEREKSPKLESGDLGEDVGDWIIAHKLMDEAKALIAGEADG